MTNASARVAIKRFVRTHAGWTAEKVYEYISNHACSTGPFRGDETLQDVKGIMASMDENRPGKLL